MSDILLNKFEKEKRVIFGILICELITNLQGEGVIPIEVLKEESNINRLLPCI